MYLIGIDSSTTATKSLIIDADGKIVAVAAAEYPFETPHPLWSEQHPDLWWDGTVQSMRAALDQSGIDPAQVAAVGVSGQMHGLVLLDEDGEPLRPAILWNDQRTANSAMICACGWAKKTSCASPATTRLPASPRPKFYG